MGTDVLAPGVAKLSTATTSIMQIKEVLLRYDDWLQQLVPFQFW